ncbi:Flavonol synthase/flavanone 3-hydroxylase [Arachis hypogaea]|nr:Flavonol synthase/flavanone 3-hydroxylase [Arachis hypogaea]
MQKNGKRVARIIALALGLDAKSFDQTLLFGELIALMFLLHYEGFESLLLCPILMFFV